MYTLGRLEDPVRVLANDGISILVILIFAAHVVQRLALGAENATAGSTGFTASAVHDLVLDILEPVVLMFYNCQCL